MIQVSGLTKDYGARRAIDHLTFDVARGEILGFLGPNGAGKTTSMRILSGFMPPTEGNVTIGGYDLIDQSLEVRRIVGYLPETVPLYNDMTVFEYLQYMGDLRHLPKVKLRVQEALEMVELADRAQGYIGKLSKGMRQRVGLAQALLHRPEVVILDEPTIGLDPGQVVRFRELIRSIGQDRTVLLSTHILPEVQQLCDRVLIINKGKIVAEDTPEKLQARLMGALRVFVRVRDGNGEGITSLINTLSAQVAGMRQIAALSEDSFEFETDPAADVRPMTARAVIEAGYDLLEFRPVAMSLEDIFLQLTREEDAVYDSDAAEEDAPNAVTPL